jgi:hypothetical protein
MKKASREGASLSWGLGGRAPFLLGSWMLSKGKPMERESLSIGASLWNMEGFHYRRLWKTTKIVPSKRIALPVGILRAESRGRAHLLGNVKVM